MYRSILASLVPSLAILVAPADPPKAAEPKPVEIEVIGIDDSKLKAKLLDVHVELNTKYGRLVIPAAEIQKIEFATRIPDDVAKRVERLVAGLGDPVFETREKAEADLRQLRERAYPALVKATKNPDAEISRRALASVHWIENHAPGYTWNRGVKDEVWIEDGRIKGTIAAASIRVRTSMFGDQTIRLTEVRTLIRPTSTPP